MTENGQPGESRLLREFFVGLSLSCVAAFEDIQASHRCPPGALPADGMAEWSRAKLMTPINSESEARRFQNLASEMTTNGYEFSTEWIRGRGWKVVPVEDGNHFALEDIMALVPALQRAGYLECFVTATEPLGDLPACYIMSITEEGFRKFNAECGLFRYIVMDEARSWAISCNEWYNLLAADPTLLESMLGRSIESARQESLNFATQLSKQPDEPLIRVARHYAEL